LLADSGRALRGVDEQVPEVADRGEPQRVLVDDVIGDTDDAVLRVLGDDRVNRRRVVQDTRPCMAGEGLGRSALVEEAVAVEQLAPAFLVAWRGPATVAIT